jgi:hypothetical protein
MHPQKSFNFVHGINLHFTSMDYSVLKYGTDTAGAKSKYASMTREQCYRFEWLSEKYPQSQDIVYACIGCQFGDVSIQYGLKEDIRGAYNAFKSRREGLTYKINSDASKRDLEGNKPLSKLIFQYLIGEYSPEYIILISGQDGMISLYNEVNLAWARPQILKLIKYRDFFNFKKYAHLINNTDSNVNVTI